MPLSRATISTEREDAGDSAQSSAVPSGRWRAFTTIDASEFDRMDALFDSSADCRAAYGAICNNMFSGEILVTGLRVDAALRSRLAFEYTALARDCVRDLLKYGIVVVTVNRADRTPHVVPPKLLRIQHRLVIGGPSEYRLFPGADALDTSHSTLAFLGATALFREPMDDVLVFETHTPDARGRLTGPMTGLVHMETFRNAMLKCAAAAHQRLAAPGLYIVQPHEPGVRAELQQSSVLEYQDANALALTAQQASAQSAALREQAVYTTAVNALGPSFGTPFGSAGGAGAAAAAVTSAARLALFGARPDEIDPLTRLPVYSTEGAQFQALPTWPLPVGKTVVAAPRADPPAMIDFIERVVEQNVAKCFGVPTELWSGQFRSAVATNQTVLTAFYSTLQTWRTDLQHIFELVLSILETNTSGGGDTPLARIGRLGETLPSPRTKKRDEAQPASAAPAATTSSSSSSSSSDSDDDDAAPAAAAAAAAPTKRRDDETKTATAPRPRRPPRSKPPGTRRVPGTGRISVAFPAVLDYSIINTLRTTGTISYATYAELTRQYYGLCADHIEREQLDPVTQLPLARETLRVRRIEQEALNRDLVEAVETTAEDLRGVTGNETGSASITGATRVPKRTTRDTSSSAAAAGGGGSSGAARAAAPSSKRGRGAGKPELTKGGTRSDRSKDPETKMPTLRSTPS